MKHKSSPLFKDLTGQTFTKLYVIKRAEGNSNFGEARWLCRCECGQEKIVLGSDLRKGITKSCGCYNHEQHSKHNGYEEKLYSVWKSMRYRCRNTNHQNYDKYGGRGIEICDEWYNSYSSFRKFAYGKGYDPNIDGCSQTIERIDVNGNYEPNNCKLASRKEQANNKRNNVYIEIDGTVKTMSQWAEYSGVNRSTIQGRYNHGVRGEDLIKHDKVKYV